MPSEQEKSLRNFEKESQVQLEPKDFVSDLVIVEEPHMDGKVIAPP
jgi:hypothetical protein